MRDMGDRRETHVRDPSRHVRDIHQNMRDTYEVATTSRLLKIQVSFAKEPYERTYILQNRLIFFRSLLIIATSSRLMSDTARRTLDV